HRGPVADVRVKEAVVGLSLDRRERREIAGIGQRIDVEDVIASLEHEISDERRAYESRAPGNDHAHRLSFMEKHADSSANDGCRRSLADRVSGSARSGHVTAMSGS